MPVQTREEATLKMQQAAQQFQDELMKLHPRIGELQSWDAILQAIIKSYTDLQIPLTSLTTAKSFWAAFHSCAQDKTIRVPAAEPIITQETINRIREKYPVIITKERPLTQRERSALAGIPERGSGRATAAERIAETKKINDRYADERKMRQTKSLKAEFQRALNDAGMLTGRTHSESSNLRKEATAKVMADPKFKALR
jgi:hypothetical protein